ncbi:MAG: hypothetical protein AAF591_12280 [Verrucomicrobiota bacterium]
MRRILFLCLGLLVVGMLGLLANKYLIVRSPPSFYAAVPVHIVELNRTKDWQFEVFPHKESLLSYLRSLENPTATLSDAVEGAEVMNDIVNEVVAWSENREEFLKFGFIDSWRNPYYVTLRDGDSPEDLVVFSMGADGLSSSNGLDEDDIAADRREAVKGYYEQAASGVGRVGKD